MSQRKKSTLFVTPLLLALAACVGAEVGPIDDPGPGPEAGTEPVLLQRSDDAVTGAVQLGRSVSTAALRCASAAFTPLERVNLWAHRFELPHLDAAGGVQINIATGLAHPDTAWEETPPEQWSVGAVMSAEGEQLSLDFGDGNIELQRHPSAKGHYFEGFMSEPHFGDVGLVCWSGDLEPRFSYDPGNGRCLDRYGHAGRDPRAPAFLRETGQGACADLAGAMLNEDNFGYPVLRGWDLRGADLSGASLYFADLLDAQLQGARMEGFSFGYATVDGAVDEHTEPPSSWCALDEETLTCAA